MSSAVVVVLAVVWAAVFLPGLLRDVRRRAPTATVGEFARSRDALGAGTSATDPLVRLHRGIRSPFDQPVATDPMEVGCGAAWGGVPTPRERVLRRRQAVITWLGASAGISILAAAVGDPWLLAPAMVFGLAFAAYLVLLAEQISRERDRALRARRAARRRRRAQVEAEVGGPRSAVPA